MNTKNTINKNYLSALSRIFTPSVMDPLALYGQSDYLAEVYSNSGLENDFDSSLTLNSFFDYVYSLLNEYYRNEYVYKNAIANKILLGRHSLRTSKMLTEFRVGKNKADVVILNGDSTVYEIKSEYDSFNRLKDQINSYFQVFDYINVITTSSQAEKMKALVPEKTGILVLTENNTISTIRKAKSNKENIKPSILFDSLRKSEYTKIIKAHYGYIPDVPNTKIHKICKKMYCEIPLEVVHDLTINTLKQREHSPYINQFIEKTPASLSAYALSISGQKKKMQNLENLLNNKVHSILYS